MAEWKEPKNDYTAAAQVTPEIFNTLAENERYLQEVKITTDQVQDASIKSTQYSSRTNISGTEVLKVCIGKIRKWFADLKALAFKATVGTSEINDSAVTDAKISSVSASKVTGLHKVATSGDYNDLKNKPTITGGGTGTVVFSGNAKYYDTNLGFKLKPGYRYAIETDSGIGEGIVYGTDDYSQLRVMIPGEAYGGDGVLDIMLVCLSTAYDGNAKYNGGGGIHIEGEVEFDGDCNADGSYGYISGSCNPTIKKVIELGKVY